MPGLSAVKLYLFSLNPACRSTCFPAYPLFMLGSHLRVQTLLEVSGWFCQRVPSVPITPLFILEDI